MEQLLSFFIDDKVSVLALMNVAHKAIWNYQE